MPAYAVPPAASFRRAEQNHGTECRREPGADHERVDDTGGLPAAAAFWAVASSWLVKAQSSPEARLADIRTLDPSGLVTIPVASSGAVERVLGGALLAAVVGAVSAVSVAAVLLNPPHPARYRWPRALSGLPTVKCRTDSLLTLLTVLQARSPADGHGSQRPSAVNTQLLLTVGVRGHPGRNRRYANRKPSDRQDQKLPEGGHRAGASKPLRLMVTGPSSCLSSSGSWVLQPSQGALLLGCTNHVRGGARQGRYLHARGQVELRGVVEYELEERRGDVAGGAGAVVLHAAGEVAAVEHRAHVEVPVGDFFTAAVLGSVNHGERGMPVGAWAAWLLCLLSLSVLGILGVFGGDLGGDALLVQAAGRSEEGCRRRCCCRVLLTFWALGPLHAAGLPLLLPSCFHPCQSRYWCCRCRWR